MNDDADNSTPAAVDDGADNSTPTAVDDGVVISTPEIARFRRYSWLALAFVLAVILWGAFVRASGSGAGCGSHWPLCNGEVIPRAPALKTMIEFTHRVTSGLAAVAVLVQFIWSRRVFASGHPAGRWAAAGAALMVIEVLLGAGIVLLEYVAENKSVGRALWMGVHLVNTFLLVGAMTLTAHCATTRGPMRFAGRVVVSVLGLVGTLGILFTAATGGVAALGDTLFPPKTIGAALAEDFSPTAHVLVRMRHIHPFAAIGTALGLLLIRHVVASRVPTPGVAWRGVTLRVAVVSQVVVGFLNMMMLAPVWMQLVHLLLADAVWIAFVLFIATALAEPDPDRDATEFSTS